MFFHSLPSRGDAVGILQMGHAGAKLIEHELFIIPPALRRPIPPAENRRFHALPLKPIREERDNRRLAGPAGRQIAHADDRHPGLMGAFQTPVEQPIAKRDPREITERKPPQSRPQQRSPGPAFLSRNQRSKFGFVHKSCRAGSRLPSSLGNDEGRQEPALHGLPGSHR